MKSIDELNSDVLEAFDDLLRSTPDEEFTASTKTTVRRRRKRSELQRQWECHLEMCSRTYASQAALRAHIRTRHLSDWEGVVDWDNIDDPYCMMIRRNASFLQKNRMQRILPNIAPHTDATLGGRSLVHISPRAAASPPIPSTSSPAPQRRLPRLQPATLPMMSSTSMPLAFSDPLPTSSSSSSSSFSSSSSSSSSSSLSSSSSSSSSSESSSSSSSFPSSSSRSLASSSSPTRSPSPLVAMRSKSTAQQRKLMSLCTSWRLDEGDATSVAYPSTLIPLEEIQVCRFAVRSGPSVTLNASFDPKFSSFYWQEVVTDPERGSKNTIIQVPWSIITTIVLERSSRPESNVFCMSIVIKDIPLMFRYEGSSWVRIPDFSRGCLQAARLHKVHFRADLLVRLSEFFEECDQLTQPLIKGAMLAKARKLPIFPQWGNSRTGFPYCSACEEAVSREAAQLNVLVRGEDEAEEPEPDIREFLAQDDDAYNDGDDDDDTPVELDTVIPLLENSTSLVFESIHQQEAAMELLSFSSKKQRQTHHEEPENQSIGDGMGSILPFDLNIPDDYAFFNEQFADTQVFGGSCTEESFNSELIFF